MDRMSNFTFYLRRLQSASFPELLYRVREFLFLARLRARFKRGRLGFPDSWIEPVALEALQVPAFNCQGDETLLQSLLSGEVFSLNGDKEAIAQFEGRYRGLFSMNIPIHQDSVDIRMVWEPARLQHLACLLVSLVNNPNRPDVTEIKTFVKDSLLTWLEDNPFLFGPHYLSAMECGLRIPVFFYALKILDNLSAEDRRRVFQAIYQHGWWITRRLSLYSSLGNHTICECLGLVFAGAIFTSRPEGRAWLKRATALLQQELGHQILADGGPAEQSFNYHRFILDLYWLAIGFLEQNGLHDCQAWKPRLILGENFLQAFSDELGQFPAIGDSDDGQAIAPTIAPKREFRVAADEV
jgi:hypothetical protein